MAVPRSKVSKAVTKRRQTINMKLKAPQLVECNNCGNLVQSHHVCPKCGSNNITEINRMNGYLGFNKVKGKSRFNLAKQAEIADRKSM